MATDVERLMVRIEATQAKFEKQLARANQTANRRATQIERRFQKMNRGISASFGTLRSGVALLGGALGVREVARYADAWTEAGNKIRAAAEISGAQVRSLSEINNIADQTRSGISATADLYAKLTRSASAYVETEEDIARATEIVNKAFKAGGAATSEFNAGVLQLAQGLSSGFLQGDELRSIRENAPLLAQALAKEFNTTIGGLKELGAAGEITTDRIVKAILDAGPDIERAFAATDATIADSFTRVQNALTEYIGTSAATTGASQKLQEALNLLADNFVGVADSVVAFATILSGALAGRAIVAAVGGIANATAALLSFVAAVRAGSAAAVTFRAALGPIGLLAGAAAAAVIAYRNWTPAIDDATRALADQAASADQITGLVDDVKRAQDAYKAAIANTANTQTSATNSIVADTKREFEAKRSLLELELKRQRALGVVQREQLRAAQSDLRSELERVNIGIDNPVARGFSDPRVGRVVRNPDAALAVERLMEVANNSPAADEVKRLRAEIDLTELSAEKLAEALDTTFRTAAGGGGVEPDDGDSNTGSGGGSGRGRTGRIASDLEDAAKAAKEFEKAQLEAQQAAEQLGQAVGGALSSLIGAFEDGKLEARELLSIVMQIISAMNGLNGGGGGFLSGLFSAIIPGFANGTRSAPGGLALVGERGPELVNLPRGSQVIPNHRIGMGGTSVVINAPINAPGADAAQLARVEQSVKDLARNVPKMVDKRTDTRNTRGTRA